MSSKVLSWDWRGQLDIDELAEALAALSDGKIRVYDVDTGSDEFAIVVSDTPMKGDEVAAAYEGSFE